MGHFEREIVGYNPVTDRNYYGDKKYVEDENDKREAYERSRREDQVRDIKIYIDNIKSSSDYKAIEKARDAIEKASALSSIEKSDWSRRLNARIQSWERVEYNKREADYKKSKEKIEQQREYNERYRKTNSDAEERWKNLRLFRKIQYFSKRPGSKYFANATIEEKEQLYRKR